MSFYPNNNNIIKFDYSFDCLNANKEVDLKIEFCDIAKGESIEYSNLDDEIELGYNSKNTFSDEMNPLHFQVKKLQILLVEEQGKQCQH